MSRLTPAHSGSMTITTPQTWWTTPQTPHKFSWSGFSFALVLKGNDRNSSISPELYKEQAGAELGHGQFKLGLDFTLIFCRFGLVELGGGICIVGWI